VTTTKPSFICVTESWLTPEIDNAMIRITGYSFFRNDRRECTTDKRRGGGSITYVLSCLRASRVDFPINYVKPCGIECNFIKYVDFDTSLAYLLCIYIPPGLKNEIFLDVKQYFIDCLDYILNTNPEASLYICGDFNQYDFSFLCSQFEFSNVVNLPTFGNNILDKFFCHERQLQSFSAKTAPPLGNAVHAHNIVFISRNVPSKDDNVHLQKVYDLRESNVSAFRKSVANADWSFLLRCNDVQQCVRHFYDILNFSLSSIPVSFVKVTSKTKAWITPVIIDLINKRWSAFRARNFPVYNHYKRKVKYEILKSKRLWSQKMCNTSKGFWSVVRDTCGNADRSINEVGSLFDNLTCAAESINLDFCKVFTKSQSFPVLPTDSCNESLEICTDSLVYEFLSKLRTDKACGGDGILPIFLKLSADVICRPISHIFNLSFRCGIFPNIWKIANVCPVPKGRPVKRDQLRPISLLPTVAKLCEKVVLLNFREPVLRFYDDRQFAYRPNSSTTCALLTVHSTVLNFLEDVEVGAVRIIAFDMSRAFDRIPHYKLLSLISTLDLPNCNLFTNWLNGYLSNRQQRVKLGKVFSSPAPVTSGVPQGSILGPVLFAVFFSSYKPNDQKCQVVKYADDVSLVLPVFKEKFDDMSLVCNEILHFENWCNMHGMLINPSKTKVLSVNFSCHPLVAVPNLDNVSVLKILGLLFNNKLNWSDHFDFVIKKVSSRLYVLRVLKSIMSHDQLVLTFQALIQPLYEYASPVFLNASNNLNLKLLSLCKRAFRIVHGYNVKTCQLCNFFDISERRISLAMKLFVKALYTTNHVLHELLPPFSRRSNRLILPFARTKRQTDSFVIACSILFNEGLRRS
jgi:hypothetical protein